MVMSVIRILFSPYLPYTVYIPPHYFIHGRYTGTENVQKTLCHLQGRTKYDMVNDNISYVYMPHRFLTWSRNNVAVLVVWVAPKRVVKS